MVMKGYLILISALEMKAYFQMLFGVIADIHFCGVLIPLQEIQSAYDQLS